MNFSAKMYQPRRLLTDWSKHFRKLKKKVCPFWKSLGQHCLFFVIFHLLT
ncbi:hypothetical protein HanPI659440_Chr07g0266481 [Helianthus annuus]|nr:hypothetical protein HanPI659440_Chr07g0266481 [Helianthus annuus]